MMFDFLVVVFLYGECVNMFWWVFESLILYVVLVIGGC